MTKQVTLDELGEMVSYVVENMATKDDIATLRAEMTTEIAGVRAEMATKEEMSAGFAAMRAEMATKEEMATGFAGIMSELTEIKARLHELEEIVENHSGYSKDIDYAFERIAAIEKHLGIKMPSTA